jgi:hypothetical protein
MTPWPASSQVGECLSTLSVSIPIAALSLCAISAGSSFDSTAAASTVIAGSMQSRTDPGIPPAAVSKYFVYLFMPRNAREAVVLPMLNITIF